VSLFPALKLPEREAGQAPALTAEAKRNDYNCVLLHILMASYCNTAQGHFTLYLFSCNANFNGRMQDKDKRAQYNCFCHAALYARNHNTAISSEL
jgi:hypothetical protein